MIRDGLTREDVRRTIGMALPSMRNDMSGFEKWCTVFRLAEPYVGEDDAAQIANEFQQDNWVYKIQV
jgi:hypothetical protein